MQQNEAKDLEEEFGNLFSNSQSDLAESEPKQRNSPQQHQRFSLVTFQQMPFTETQSDQDFLDQVDQVLDHEIEGEGEPSRREVMLNFKINELKNVCKNLKQINKQLRQRNRQLQESHPSDGHIESSISIQNRGDLTAIQQDFVELEYQLKNYKDQLSEYQQKMADETVKKQKQIDKLQCEAIDAQKLRKTVQQMGQDLVEKDRVITMLERRNQELLLELEERQEEEEEGWLGRYQGNRDYFNEKISSELQSMIDKLLKELKLEKKTSSRQVSQIKRLNDQIMELEQTIKAKNKKIYELEFSLIKINKINQQVSSKGFIRQKDRSPKKKDYSDSSSSFQREDLQVYFPKSQRNPYLMPQKRAEKDYGVQNRSHQTNRSYDKNRMSAQRQNPVQNVYLPQPRLRVSHGLTNPLNKPLSFTLMDLLNKEFKIRQVQKEVIASRIIELYSQKIIQQSYQNLIPEQIQIYNFIPQKLPQIKVRISLINMNKGEQQSITEQKLLYNMAFILDNLLAQVEVVDAYLQRPLQLNISDYISELQNKASREEKYKMLQQLAQNIESYALQQ